MGDIDKWSMLTSMHQALLLKDGIEKKEEDDLPESTITCTNHYKELNNIKKSKERL